MARTLARVHAAHRNCTPRSEVDSDQPAGSPDPSSLLSAPPASSEEPHLAHVRRTVRG
jgi:hypothetical protein